jgi:hypothetical protein
MTQKMDKPSFERVVGKRPNCKHVTTSGSEGTTSTSQFMQGCKNLQFVFLH